MRTRHPFVHCIAPSTGPAAPTQRHCPLDDPQKGIAPKLLPFTSQWQ